MRISHRLCPRINNQLLAACFLGVGLAAVIAPDYANAQKPTSAVASGRTVTVSTEPASTVWIDGVNYGRTNDGGKLKITLVAPGAHKLRVRADGFKEKTLTVTAAQKGEVQVELAKTTDESELSFQLAERLLRTDREKAAEAYNKAIKLRPNFVEAFIGLARVYSEGGQTDKAQNAIKGLRKIDPRSAEASTIEGRIFKDSGDDDKAIASFKRAITEAVGFQPEANTGLGLIFKERAESAGASGDYDQERLSYAQASKYFSLAIKQLSGAPDAVVLYQFLGLVYEQQKKYKEAIAVYQEFLRLFPNDPESAAFESYIVQLKKQLNESK